MKTKVRLNCYFFSNLIVGLLALNFLFSKEENLVQVKKDGGKLEPIYVMAPKVIEEEKEEIKEEPKEVISNNVTTISVTKKTLASKKVINYVKPSYNSVTGTNLVNYAKHYLGLPYISAGRSLETGTDCSGFTRLIFREFGISLGTTVASQLYSGSYVSKSDLQPGDLVFYGYSTSKATHVAIYIGGGQIIHESTPRDGVKISPVNIMVYITARRLITKNVVHEEEVKEEVKETKVPESPNVQETKPQEEVKAEVKKEEKVEVNKETPKEPVKEEKEEKQEEKVEVKKPETPKDPEIVVPPKDEETPKVEQKEEVKEVPEVEVKEEKTEVKEEVKEEIPEKAPEQPKVEEVVPERIVEEPKEVTPQEEVETTNNTNINENTSINNTEETIETSEIAK